MTTPEDIVIRVIPEGVTIGDVVFAESPTLLEVQKQLANAKVKILEAFIVEGKEAGGELDLRTWQ